MSDIAAAPQLAREQKGRETAQGLWRLAKAIRAQADVVLDVPHLESFYKNTQWLLATMRTIPPLNMARMHHTDLAFKRACLRQLQENVKGMLTSLSLLWVEIGKELKKLDEPTVGGQPLTDHQKACLARFREGPPKVAPAEDCDDTEPTLCAKCGKLDGYAHAGKGTLNLNKVCRACVEAGRDP